MDLRIPTFEVLLAGRRPDEPDTFTVTVGVRTGDQLLAELEAGQLGLPLTFSQAPTHHTALWLWAALTRMGYTDERFKAFQPRLLTVARLDDDDDEEGVTVDPTGPGQPTETD